MGSSHKTALLIAGVLGATVARSVAAQPVVAHIRLAAIRRPFESRETILPRWLALRDLTAALATDPTMVINGPGQPYARITVVIESVTQDADWVVTASVRPLDAKRIPLEGRGATMTLAVQHLAEAFEEWRHALRP